MQPFYEQLKHTILNEDISTKLAKINYVYNKRKLVLHCGSARLYHYQPTCRKIHTTPVLMIFALVNKPEILDLMPEQSFVRKLLDQGLEIYLLDWGCPDDSDVTQTLDHYLSNVMRQSVKYILRATKHQQLDIVGICQGGVFSLCYAALFKHVRRLVLLSTPVDFHTEDNIISQLVKRLDVAALKLAKGNIPGTWLTQFFTQLRPFELLGKKYLKLVDHRFDEAFVDKFMRVEKWLYDARDQARDAFVEFLEQFYQQNNLIQRRIQFQDKVVDLSSLTLPVLNILGKNDNIIPPSASRALAKHVPASLYREAEFSGGHMSFYINDHTSASVSKQIADWLK